MANCWFVGVWFVFCMESMTSETETARRLQGEISKVNAAYVSLACEYRESKTALQARIKALETDLAISKDTCKNQEYHIANSANGVSSRGSGKGAKTEKSEAEKELEKKTMELEAATQRIGELEGLEEETVVLRKRVRELEPGHRAWKHLRAVVLSQ